MQDVVSRLLVVLVGSELGGDAAHSRHCLAVFFEVRGGWSKPNITTLNGQNGTVMLMCDGHLTGLLRKPYLLQYALHW